MTMTTTRTAAASPMTRGDRLTVVLAVVLLAVLALRGIELGWPTGLVALVALGASLAALAPAVRLVQRRRTGAHPHRPR